MVNKDENVHRFALSPIKGELLESKRDRFGILCTAYLLSIVKIRREIETERKRDRDRERGKRERKKRKTERKRERKKERKRERWERERVK